MQRITILLSFLAYVHAIRYTYTYSQSTGVFTGLSINKDTIKTTGCSGAVGHCRNNASAEIEKDCGPLPIGTYQLSSMITYHKMPYCYVLTQISGSTYNRSGFLIHGGNCSKGNPSIGCIVIEDSNIRYKIKGKSLLKVIH